ncbi:Regulatory protein SoxS [compost metagenome]
MHFLLPHAHNENIIPEKVKEEYKHLIMPFAKGVQTVGSFGAIVTQVFKGLDYEIWQHHFFIKEAITLYAVTDAPILTINFMLKGSPLARLENIGELPLAENTAQFFYVPPIRQNVWFESGVYHCLHIVFSTSYIKRLMTTHHSLQSLKDCVARKSKEIFLHSSGKINLKMRKILEEIMNCHMEAGETDLNIQSKVLSLLLHYIRRYGAINNTSSFASTEEFIEAINVYIESNIGQHISIKELAKKFGKSQSEFHKIFKDNFNASPHHYVTSLRLNLAMNLIRNTTYSCGEIAAIVGYEELSHFSSAFRKQFGNSPNSFRKR